MRIASIRRGYRQAPGDVLALSGHHAWDGRRDRRRGAAGMSHRVVVIGGGFGGLAAVRSLRGSGAAVVLIDRRNFHLFQPLLYQVATGSLAAGEIASPRRCAGGPRGGGEGTWCAARSRRTARRPARSSSTRSATATRSPCPTTR